jgi:hypothetical protein
MLFNQFLKGHKTFVEEQKESAGKYSEIIADNLSKAGWSLGCSSQIDSTGRVLFTADAYGRDGRRFTVLSDDRLGAFLELERGTRDDSH